MKKLVFKLIAIFIVITLSMHSTVAIAANSIDTWKSEQEKNKNEINEKRDEIDEVKEQKSQTVKEVEELDNKISSYEAQIAELDSKISSLNNQISQKESELKQAEEEQVKQQDLLDKRLVAMQEDGETRFLDFLLSSESLVDFISSYYLITEMANSDTKLIEEIQKQKEAISKTKTELEGDKREKATAKASVEGIQTQLQSAKNQKNKQVAQLSQTEKELQAQIDELNQANKSIDAKIQQELARQAAANKSGNSSVTVTKPSAAGFIAPLPAAYARITTGIYYSTGQYHGAVDYGSGGINGQPIYAVADGTVIISEKHYSYGNYILINHNNGLFTLYAHGQDGTRAVSAGQKVKQGQQIMKVGNTGNSTGPHLHFEVRTYPGNHSNRVDPRPYLP